MKSEEIILIMAMFNETLKTLVVQNNVKFKVDTNEFMINKALKIIVK